MTDTPKRPARDPGQIARICEHIYRAQLADGGARMVAEDKDDGARLRRRALCYERVVRLALDALDALDAEPVQVTCAMIDAALMAPVLTYRDWPHRLAELPAENARRVIAAALGARAHG